MFADAHDTQLCIHRISIVYLLSNVMNKEWFSETRTRMEKVIEMLRDGLATVRVGRASSSFVENVLVEVYGTRMRIMELALINTPEPNQIVIKPYDVSNVDSIKKAILQANLGFNAVVDGELVRITIPPLTSERREELVKLIGQKLEGARISIRQVRQEAMKNIDQKFEEKEFSEDEKFRLREEVQKTVDEFNEKIENLGKAKEEELKSL